MKSKTRPTPSDASGLRAFRATYPTLNVANGLVVCLSEESYALTEEDFALPWNAVL